MSIKVQAFNYYNLRGLDTSSWEDQPRGSKLAEETGELREALLNLWWYTDEHEDLVPAALEHAKHEVADVAIALAWIAEKLGTTIERCIELKTIKDAGRDVK